MGYGIGRFWIEGLRIDPVELSDVGGLRWNQWVALAAIVGGAGYLLATHGRRWPDDVGTDEVETGELGPDALDPSVDVRDELDRTTSWSTTPTRPSRVATNSTRPSTPTSTSTSTPDTDDAGAPDRRLDGSAD